jgi:predicted dehydrogenase
MTRALVIGYGSIGQRHAQVLRELGCRVGVVSRRELAEEDCFGTIAHGVTVMSPDYVVIANETSAHRAAVEEVRAAGFTGALLVEKPLGAGPSMAAGTFATAAIGYNLRFHPVVMALAAELAAERIITAEIYCGQYLPDWHPGSDYRRGYSADPARGGGVLRDLSHELDYLLWLAGPWRRVVAVGGRLSPLEIASDDCWAMLVQLENCPLATVQINYLDRPGRRRITINTADHTYCADLSQAILVRDGEARAFVVGRDDTYRSQHRAMLSGDTARLCSIAQAEQVMQLIEATESSARRGSWVAA